MWPLHFSGISVAAINILAFVFAILFSSRLLRWRTSAVYGVPARGSFGCRRGSGVEFMYQSPA